MEGNEVEFQFLFYSILIIGMIITVWIILTSSKRIYRERLDVIKNKVDSIGGTVSKIIEVDRSDCPLCNDFMDTEFRYKFFKFNYQHENVEKEAWAILSIKQTKLGRIDGTDSEWLWWF